MLCRWIFSSFHLPSWPVSCKINFNTHMPEKNKIPSSESSTDMCSPSPSLYYNQFCKIRFQLTSWWWVWSCPKPPWCLALAVTCPTRTKNMRHYTSHIKLPWSNNTWSGPCKPGQHLSWYDSCVCGFSFAWGRQVTLRALAKVADAEKLAHVFVISRLDYRNSLAGHSTILSNYNTMVSEWRATSASKSLKK